MTGRNGGQQEAHRDKVTLLYALLHLGQCTEDQLVRFSDAVGLMDQFQLYVALGELKEAWMVGESRQIEGNLLKVTDEGKKTLELFGKDIWPSSKVQVDNRVAEWRRKVRDELQMPAEWQRSDEGYTVSLRLLEAGRETFNLTMVAVDKQQAMDFCKRWPEQASFLYRTIMEKLGEGRKEK